MAEVSDWHKLYSEGWTGLIVPEAFGHPAKYSRALIRHIYQHLIDKGWLEPGATVIDPFAGVALGALHAMKHGLNWVGVELEEKFVDLGQQNIDLWNSRFSQLPGWGRAVILQGDSRGLVEVVGGASGCVSSPPYASSDMGNRGGEGPNTQWRDGEFKSKEEIAKRQLGEGYGTDPANLGNMPEGKLADAVVSSPPYASAKAHPSIGTVNKDDWGNDGRDIVSRRDLDAEYGASNGQLANMPEGEFDGVVASPGYCSSEMSDKRRTYNAFLRGEGRTGNRKPSRGNLVPRYGAYSADGNINTLPEGEFEACVSSPPYEGSDPSATHVQGHSRLDPDSPNYRPFAVRSIAEGYNEPREYGFAEGQLGNSTGDTFWSAAKTIVQQVYQLLAPGSPAVWVVKAFVRKGKRVDFPGQWQQLCESVGFETVHIHRAWLVEDRGSQYDLFGELHEKRVERKSFFRRLAERKGSPRIDYEVILCQRKP